MTSAPALAASTSLASRLQPMANAIRALSMDAVEQAKSGHPGMPMGMADVATVLFANHLRFDASAPRWPNRDRFILSAGHGSMLLYSLLHLTGYEDMPMDELKRFRQLHARAAGHPEFGEAAGIETTTGPLGQGLGNAVGMALAERMMNAHYGDLVQHHTYVIAGDGCLMEGISQESITLAGHLGLSRLIVLWDDNKISIDGPTSLTTSEDTLGRFTAAGWDVQAVDGHDMQAIDAAIAQAKTTDKPSLIACRTVIAYGAPTKAGSEKSHGSPLGADEIAGARHRLMWHHAPFEIPSAIQESWKAIGKQHQAERKDWEGKLATHPKRQEFERRLSGDLPNSIWPVLTEARAALFTNQPKEATRVSSQKVLELFAPHLPELTGGSADLTGSNNTKTAGMKPVQKNQYDGHYIYYGIREHGMAAAMNGLSLYGGFIPYGGTFLVFTDYCRPSIRLSALMKQRVIYVMTHDSIGLGEDGPTHQPVEHLASLRAMPNLHVFRPCDALETLECWEQALRQPETPSILALSRQNLPFLRRNDGPENLCHRGAYVISPAKGRMDGIILATGSEVAIAVEAQTMLAEEGIHTQVVSVPCLELFLKQSPDYRAQILPEGVAVVAVEAGVRFGWDCLLGTKGRFVGMEGFGASAPAPVLYEHFGITPKAVARAIKEQLV